MNWDEVWRFETARFAVVGEVTESDIDPEEQLDAEGVEHIRAGLSQRFDARVRVILIETGQTLGEDHLGACNYTDPVDLFRDHTYTLRHLKRHRRDHANSLNHARYLRNRPNGLRSDPKTIANNLAHAGATRRRIAEAKQELQHRAALVPPVVYGYYGLDMIANAITEARKTLRRMRDIPMRESAQ